MPLRVCPDGITPSHLRKWTVAWFLNVATYWKYKKYLKVSPSLQLWVQSAGSTWYPIDTTVIKSSFIRDQGISSQSHSVCQFFFSASVFFSLLGNLPIHTWNQTKLFQKDPALCQDSFTDFMGLQSWWWGYSNWLKGKTLKYKTNQLDMPNQISTNKKPDEFVGVIRNDEVLYTFILKWYWPSKLPSPLTRMISTDFIKVPRVYEIFIATSCCGYWLYISSIYMINWN